MKDVTIRVVEDKRILTVDEENKLLAKELRIQETALELTQKKTFEVMRCVKCPIIKECPHTKEKLKVLFSKAREVAQAIYEEECELDESKYGELKASQIRDTVIDRYIQDHSYEYLKNERCIFERKEIMSNLQKFVDAGYDISDPRTYIILNELMNNILNSGRLSKAFTNMGVSIRKETPDGTVFLPNPSLTFQHNISQFIIDALAALDKMLKSDEEQIKAKDFTEHIIKALKLSPKQKIQIAEGFDKPIIVDAEFKDRSSKENGIDNNDRNRKETKET